jgi:hypothetical protein
VSPYRVALLSAERRARASHRLLTRGLVPLTAVVLGGAAFASGWAVGRAAPAAIVQVPVVQSCACPPERDETGPDPAQKSAGEAHAKAYAISPAQAQATIAARARVILAALGRRDAKALSGFIHPGERLVLGSVDGSESLVLSPAEIVRCFEDTRERLVGGENVATCGELWQRHLSGPNFARASEVDYNLPSRDGHPALMVDGENDGALDPTLQAHTGSIVAQYVVRRPEQDFSWELASEQGWSTVRLVFDPHDEQWMLTAVLWSDWSIAHSNE